MVGMGIGIRWNTAEVHSLTCCYISPPSASSTINLIWLQALEPFANGSCVNGDKFWDLSHADPPKMSFDRNALEIWLKPSNLVVPRKIVLHHLLEQLFLQLFRVFLMT